MKPTRQMKYPGSGAIAGVLIVLFSIAGAPGQDVAVTSNGTVLSGGPPPTEARHALQDRIEQESAGRITLLDFKPITTKFADVELEGRTFCEVQFEARIGFTESCRWAIQFGGRPLTFKTLKPGEQSPGVSSMHGPGHRSFREKRTVLSSWIGLVYPRNERVEASRFRQVRYASGYVGCSK